MVTKATRARARGVVLHSAVVKARTSGLPPP